MYLCYIDESGTSSIPGNTSHFVLVGISIPIGSWKTCDGSIRVIKTKYGLEDAEIHTAWILRSYLEQRKIKDFDSLDYAQRITEVQSLRKSELYRLQRSGNLKNYYQTKKNYRETEKYIHLNQAERKAFIKEIAQCISGWGFAHLFAECIDKAYFDPSRTLKTVDEQAFEQLVSRFEQCLRRNKSTIPDYGLLIHDNNQTVAEKHTKLMKKFFQTGTLWTAINNIIETPLFVDSQLTSMIQIADVCGYSIRKYLENDDHELFDLVFQRADTFNGKVVGVRHFTKSNCSCQICRAHK
jgi:hypothetical protein